MGKQVVASDPKPAGPWESEGEKTVSFKNVISPGYSSATLTESCNT